MTNKKYFLIVFIFVVIFVSACENRPILECPKPTECQKCPEKICPSCPSCKQVKPQDKPLITESLGTIVAPSPFSDDRHYYNAYSIINPNDRRVLVNFKTYCYDINDTERTFEEKHFINEKSEYYDATNGNHYFTAFCHGDWHKVRVEVEIID